MHCRHSRLLIVITRCVIHTVPFSKSPMSLFNSCRKSRPINFSVGSSHQKSAPCRSINLHNLSIHFLQRKIMHSALACRKQQWCDWSRSPACVRITGSFVVQHWYRRSPSPLSGDTPIRSLLNLSKQRVHIRSPILFRIYPYIRDAVLPLRKHRHVINVFSNGYISRKIRLTLTIAFSLIEFISMNHWWLARIITGCFVRQSYG